MIFVVEIPPSGEPGAWFAFDAVDLLRKVALTDVKADHEIWDSASARELLADLDETPESDGVASRLPSLCALGASHGWDTQLYRADHLREPGLYTPAPVGIVDACRAALLARGGQWRVYEGEEMALVAADAPDPCYDGRLGWLARHALRQQLIAVEALSDDL
ncbi:MAG: hypothetical protein RL375_4574 [Pseudomonadota bacterium]